MPTLFETLTSMSVGQTILGSFGAVVASFMSYIVYYRITEKLKPFNSYTTSTEAIDGLDLTNKYAIVTGSNTGLFVC